MQEKNTMSELIFFEMKKVGWNQTDLSKASGVDQPVISRLLRGRLTGKGGKQISVDNIFKILKALNLLKFIEEGVKMQTEFDPKLRDFFIETINELKKENQELKEKIKEFKEWDGTERRKKNTN